MLDGGCIPKVICTVFQMDLEKWESNNK
jgi:hypothetical protein